MQYMVGFDDDWDDNIDQNLFFHTESWWWLGSEKKYKSIKCNKSYFAETCKAD